MTNLIVVSGPPCAGKTTYVNEHRAPADLIIDLDRIAYAFGYPTEQIDVAKPHAARNAAMVARASILKHLPYKDVRTWVIDTKANPIVWERRGAQVIVLDPGPEECHRRSAADFRNPSTDIEIDAWYAERSGSRDW